MTGPIVLVQDERRSPGLLLMYPVYQRDMPRTTLEQRRAALRGWTYAPIIARNFLDGLTHGQSSEYRLRIYDGNAPAARGADLRAATRSLGARPAFSQAQHASRPCSGAGCWSGRARRRSSAPNARPIRCAS